MTKDELIKLGKHKVRRDSNLMSIYINLFKEQFGYKPNCASCSFETDWKRFNSGGQITTHKTITNTTMEKSYRLKRNTSDILAYKANGKTYRSYANKASEAFMSAYLTNGTEKELSDRRKLFEVLPQELTKVPAEPMTVIELVEFLNHEKDIEVIKGLLTSETRKTAIKEINKRISELQG